MYEHESIVQARLNNSLRDAMDNYPDRIDLAFQKQGIDIRKRGHKQFLGYYDSICNLSKDFNVLSEKRNPRYGKNTLAYLLSIAPMIFKDDECGNILSCRLHAMNAKNFKKGDIEYNYLCTVFLHEHYLVRKMHRTDEKTVSKASQIIIGLLRLAAKHNLTTQELPDHFYLVDSKYAIPVTNTSSHSRVVVKTVLLREKMTAIQNKKFGLAFSKMNSNKDKSLFLVDDFGNILFDLREKEGAFSYSLHDLLEKAPSWFSPDDELDDFEPEELINMTEELHTSVKIRRKSGSPITCEELWDVSRQDAIREKFFSN